MELVLDIVLDALKDTLVLVPFLWLTYLAMEALETKAARKAVEAVQKAGKAGPVLGGVLGVVPQCGFSAVAATLWSGRLVTVGTLIAVFLSTSDELLPVFLAEGAPLGLVGPYPADQDGHRHRGRAGGRRRSTAAAPRRRRPHARARAL